MSTYLDISIFVDEAQAVLKAPHAADATARDVLDDLILRLLRLPVDVRQDRPDELKGPKCVDHALNDVTHKQRGGKFRRGHLNAKSDVRVECAVGRLRSFLEISSRMCEKPEGEGSQHKLKFRRAVDGETHHAYTTALPDRFTPLSLQNPSHLH